MNLLGLRPRWLLLADATTSSTSCEHSIVTTLSASIACVLQIRLDQSTVLVPVIECCQLLRSLLVVLVLHTQASLLDT